MLVGDRFWSKVNKRGGYPDFTDHYIRVTLDDGECWLWTGARSGAGYGRFKVEGSLYSPHRLVLGWSNPLVDISSLDVDHLCRRPSCVNPTHLEAVTRSENVRRGSGPDVARGRSSDYCSKGHDKRVTGVAWGGNCLECNRRSKRDYMRRVRQKQKESQ